jgi:hypothetical protein
MTLLKNEMLKYKTQKSAHLHPVLVTLTSSTLASTNLSAKSGGGKKRTWQEFMKESDG